MPIKYATFLSSIVVGILATLLGSGCATYPLQDGPRKYVTSAVSVLDNDGIVVHVLNYDTVTRTARVHIYKNTGAGAVEVVDTGDKQVVATWNWGLGYTVQDSGEYWVELDLNSEKLVPKVSFEKYDGGRWVPITMYLPGDFAVFDPQLRRLW